MAKRQADSDVPAVVLTDAAWNELDGIVSSRSVSRLVAWADAWL